MRSLYPKCLLINDESQPVPAPLPLHPKYRLSREVISHVEGGDFTHTHTRREEEVYQGEVSERPVVTGRGFRRFSLSRLPRPPCRVETVK